MNVELGEGKVYNFLLKGRKDASSAFVLSDGLEWVLGMNNPVDYVFDGYVLIRKNKIQHIERTDRQVIIEKTVLARKLTFNQMNIDLNNTKSLFDNLIMSENIIQFDLQEDDICFIGLPIKVSSNILTIKPIDNHFQLLDVEDYRLDEIYTIELNTDYLKTIIAMIN